MEIEYKVTNQIVARKTRNRPVNKSQKYLKLAFTFSTDWDGLAKFALFKTSQGAMRVALSEDKVLVPASLLEGQRILFSLYGIDNEELRITTNITLIELLESGFTKDTINDDSELDEPTTVEEIYLEIEKKPYTSEVNTWLEGKSDTTHTHDPRYYTKTEVDTIVYNIQNSIQLELDTGIIEIGDEATFTVFVKRNGLQREGETVNIYAIE